MKEKFGLILTDKKIVNLDIPDDYHFMDEELIDILHVRVSEIIDY